MKVCNTFTPLIKGNCFIHKLCIPHSNNSRATTEFKLKCNRECGGHQRYRTIQDCVVFVQPPSQIRQQKYFAQKYGQQPTIIITSCPRFLAKFGGRANEHFKAAVLIHKFWLMNRNTTPGAARVGKQ